MPPRDIREKIIDIAAIGFVVGLILGIISFIMAFVQFGVAIVFAIFTAIFIISGCIFIATDLIIKSIEKT
jgi:hypothetical protein